MAPVRIGVFPTGISGSDTTRVNSRPAGSTSQTPVMSCPPRRAKTAMPSGSQTGGVTTPTASAISARGSLVVISGPRSTCPVSTTILPAAIVRWPLSSRGLRMRRKKISVPSADHTGHWS